MAAKEHQEMRNSPPVVKNLCFTVLLAATLTVAAEPALLKFERLVTFFSTDNVRLAATIRAAEEGGAGDLGARIARFPAGELLWQGSLGQAEARAGIAALVNHTVSDLKPDLWSPASPVLYELKLTAKKNDRVLAERTVRFGFRAFESRNGQFQLNGRPIFLRGIAINPPGRGVPPAVGESRAFAEAYVHFLKSRNVNTIRLTYDSQAWFDVCDELGMMIYQGQYGSPLESDERKQQPPTDFARSVNAYKQLFETYASHPCILIYVLSNELPVSGTRGQAFHDFLSRAHAALKPWDSTRLYIGNAGYGEGREGDICDVHRYWGWYYNSFLTYYNLRDPQV